MVEGQVKVVADEPNNALIVTTFPRNWPLIEDTIRKLDRTPKQVLIEVLVAEVGLTDENRLGIEWAIRSQRDINVGGTPYNVGSVAKVDVGPPLDAARRPRPRPSRRSAAVAARRPRPDSASSSSRPTASSGSSTSTPTTAS